MGCKHNWVIIESRWIGGILANNLKKKYVSHCNKCGNIKEKIINFREEEKQ